MNECERRKCEHWVKDHCADPVDYVDEDGNASCRYREGVTVKFDLSAELHRCIRNAKEHIQYEAYNDALSSLNEAEELVGNISSSE